MIRLFVYLMIILALGFGFSWVADRPGLVTLDWQGTVYETSLMVVSGALVIIIGTILFAWALFRGIVRFPGIVSHYLSNRRRDRGYEALSRGLIAAGTGDAARARQSGKESNRFLENEPLVALLSAQTALLEGKHDEARGQFEKMLENEDTRLLGLRGLYLEAEKLGEREAAAHYANKAAELAPALGWAGNAKLRNQALAGQWEDALRTLETNRAAALVDKDIAKRHRAVLLTARAFEQEPTDPDLAAKLAKEANRLAPDLVAAALIGAKALVRGNDLRRASKLIESVWKLSPHPELAESYVHLRAGDSASDRLARARKLANMRTNHHEGAIAIALAAIDAKEWKIARDAMQGVLTNHISEKACLIMADLEEGENGDQGRMRDWLSRAVRAPRDHAWAAGTYTSKIWLPVSPLTGEIDAFEWKIPTEQIQETNTTIEIGDLAEPLKIAPQPAEIPKEPEASDEKPDVPVVAAAASTAAIVSETAPNDDTEASEKPENQEGDNAQVSAEPSAEIELVAEKSEIVEKPDSKDKALEEKTETQSVEKSEEPEDNTDNDTVFPLKRRPDDPGVDGDKPEEKSAYKLF